MNPEQFNEMVAINTALNGRYTVALATVAFGLNFWPDEAPDKETLEEYILRIVVEPITSKIFFTGNGKFNKLELDTSVIIDWIKAELGDSFYSKTVEVKNVLINKTETITTPSYAFLEAVLAQIPEGKKLITYKEVCDSFNKAASTFLKDIETYIQQLKQNKFIWKHFYKPHAAFKSRYKYIEESIEGLYTNNYHLTENNYNQAIDKWISELCEDMKEFKIPSKDDPNPGLEAVPIVEKTFLTLIDNRFNNMGSEYPVYEQMETIFTNLVKKAPKPYLMGNMAKYVKDNLSNITYPPYDQPTYYSITDSSEIYDKLKGFKFKDEVLKKSLDKTNKIFYQQDPTLHQNFEDFKASIVPFIKKWKNDIAAQLLNIAVVGLPDTDKITSALETTFKGYPDDVCDKTYQLILDSFTSSNIYHSQKLLNDVRAKLSSQEIVLDDIDTLAETWWEQWDATLDGDSDLTQKDLLPHSITVTNAFNNNILADVTPQAFDDSIREWRNDVKGAISLIEIEVPEGTTIVGKDFLDHLTPLFNADILKTLWDQIKSALPSEQETLPIADLRAQWIQALSDENLDNMVIASQSEKSDGIGMLFLDFYDAYKDTKHRIKAFCDSAYVILPSKEELAISVKNAIKKKPPQPRKGSKVQKLTESVGILELKDRYFVLQNSILGRYRTAANYSSDWVIAIDHLSLAYVKARQIYLRSYEDCEKTNKSQVSTYNTVVGTIAVGIGVAAAVYAGPAILGKAALDALGRYILVGPVIGYIGGTTGKAASTLLLDSAKNFEDPNQTGLEFYLENKTTFPVDLRDLKAQIEALMSGIDDAIKYLNNNGLEAPDEVRDPNFNLKTQQAGINGFIEKVNTLLEGLDEANTAIFNHTMSLKLKADAIDIMERNLYRPFIKTNFSQSSYTEFNSDWDLICAASIFKKRLEELGVITSSHFLDYVFSNSDAKEDMKVLFTFARADSEKYTQ